MAMTVSILNGFAEFFRCCKTDKFSIKFMLVTHHTLSMLLHYLGKLKNHFRRHTPETLSTLQLASAESVSRHVYMQMVDILNTFLCVCEQTYANNLHFMCFLLQVAFAHGVRFLLC